MRTSIILFILFCGIAAMTAQTRYYDETKVFNEDGYTYKCDVGPGRIVTLYNATNRYTYKRQKYLSTGENVVGTLNGVYEPECEMDTCMMSKCYSIINNAFTKEEEERCRDRSLGIMLIINSQTGKLLEVHFDFYALSPFATIPVSVYRKIETQILNSGISFVTTEAGKKLDFILIYWTQKIGEQHPF